MPRTTAFTQWRNVVGAIQRCESAF
jgi:hypothetical protein